MQAAVVSHRVHKCELLRHHSWVKGQEVWALVFIAILLQHGEGAGAVVQDWEWARTMEITVKMISQETSQ